MTQLFKWFLRTGKIPHFLLICSLVPIVKDNLSDICNSDNYRAIAIGSLLLKWFDWLILILMRINYPVKNCSLDFNLVVEQLCVPGPYPR